MPRGKSSFVCREGGCVSLASLGWCLGCNSWNPIDEAARPGLCLPSQGRRGHVGARPRAFGRGGRRGRTPASTPGSGS